MGENEFKTEHHNDCVAGFKIEILKFPAKWRENHLEVSEFDL